MLFLGQKRCFVSQIHKKGEFSASKMTVFSREHLRYFDISAYLAPLLLMIFQAPLDHEV